METITQISVDLLLIGRCFAALTWGILWAMYLQHARLGKFLAAERAWLAVVVGVGMDLAIAFGGDWWTCVAVVGCSSIGVIGRSLWNEEFHVPSGYRVLWGLEETIAISKTLVEVLEALVEDEKGKRAVQVSKALGMAHRLNDLVRDARRGEYHGR